MNCHHFARIPTHDNTTGDGIWGSTAPQPLALFLYIALKRGDAKPEGGICEFSLFNINCRSIWLANI